MSETDAGRILRILAADRIDLRVKAHALAICITAVRFGGWPASLRPQLAEAALEICGAPPICLLPQFRGAKMELTPLTARHMRGIVYSLLHVLRDPNGRKVLEQAATEDPEELCREAAKRYLREW